MIFLCIEHARIFVMSVAQMDGVLKLALGETNCSFAPHSKCLEERN